MLHNQFSKTLTSNYLLYTLFYLNNHFYSFIIIIIVRAKNEVDGPVLTQAHNLFVMWALDFLPWVVPNTETQLCNFSPLNPSPFPITTLLVLTLSALSSRLEPTNRPFLILISYLQLRISRGGVMITRSYQWVQGSNSIAFKWVFSWEWEWWLWNWFSPLGGHSAAIFPRVLPSSRDIVSSSDHIPG